MTENDSSFDSEVSESDALEQAIPVDPNAPDEPDLTDIPLDAPESDVVDQRREVTLDEEYPPT